MVQWLRLCASTVGGMGLIPGWGTKIPRAVQRGQKKSKLSIFFFFFFAYMSSFQDLNSPVELWCV